MTDDHLSLDELAELDEGLLPPERTSAIRAHLHGCAQCRARADAITSTRSLLAGLPAEPMPVDVATRVDRALLDEASRTGEASRADEAGKSDISPASDRPSGSTTVVPNVVTLPRRRFGRPTMAATAAAAAVVLAVGAIVVAHANHPSHESAGSAGTTTAGALGGQSLPTTSLPTSATGTTYTPAALPAQVESLLSVKAVSGNTAGSTAGVPTPAATPSASARHGVARKGTGTSTKPRAANRSTPSSPEQEFSSAQAPVSQSLAPLRSSPAKLLACAQSVAPTVGGLPIAVDFGRWGGPPYRRAPSVIFVYAGTSPSTVRVVVVGPSCASDAVRQFTQVTLPS